MAEARPSCLLAVKVIPGAAREEVAGWLGEALKIKVKAPPVDGRANVALCEFLAGRLGLPRRAVTVRQGESSRQKLIAIEGLNLAEARARLGVTA